MDSSPKNRGRTASSMGGFPAIVAWQDNLDKSSYMKWKRKTIHAKVGERGFKLKAAIRRLKYKKEQNA